MSAHPDIPVFEVTKFPIFYLSFSPLYGILTIRVLHHLTLRCVTVRRRLGGMPLAWL